jgi:uroporphyrinogen decarboxylase
MNSKNNLPLMNSFFSILQKLLEKNIQLQLDGGAEVVMIFDTAAGEVSPLFFKKHIAPQLAILAEKFPGKLGYYSKGTQASFFDEHFLNLKWAGMGFDHRYSMSDLLSNKKTPGFIQGNFDQAQLFADEANFKQHLDSYIGSLKEIPAEARQSWVSGLGHGVLPKTPEANVRKFIETIRKEF